MIARNPRYDGLYVFKPDLTKLLSGDIFLTRNAESTSFKGKAQSDTIATAIGGNFSHALLCTTPPTLIEAIGDGVSHVTAQNCFAHDLKHVRVLRYKNKKIAKTAGSIALRFLGKGYSLRSAIRSAIPSASVPELPGDQTFCSALVATAFRAAGAPEFETIDPARTTPATLEMATCFDDVTSEVFSKILAPPNIEKMNALDGDRMPSPLAGQTKLFNGYHAKLSPLIQAFLNQYPDFPSQKLDSFTDCIDFIITTLAVVRRLPCSVEVDEALRQLISIDEAAFNLLAEGKWQEMARAAQISDDASHRYSLEESFKRKPDVSLDDLQGMIHATELQVTSRSSILDDPERPLGVSRVWDEWIKIAQRIIESQQRRLVILREVRDRVFPSARRAG